MANLKERYQNEVMAQLKEQFSYANVMQVPRITKVTLRRERMWEFLDRLVNIAIPRVRDFRGLNPKSFDGRGNYSMGVREQIIFPEIEYDKIDRIRGLDVTITTSAITDEEGRALLSALNFPFKQ